jgi:hypothetical protein
MIVCFKFFGKNSSRPFSSSSFISFSFLVRFEWFKMWWARQLGLYKTSLVSQRQCYNDAMIKDLKLEILICFDLVITKHWTPLHQTPHVFPIPSPNWEIFVMSKSLGVGLKYFLSFKIKRTMCEDSTLFEFLNVSPSTYLPYLSQLPWRILTSLKW